MLSLPVQRANQGAHRLPTFCFHTSHNATQDKTRQDKTTHKQCAHNHLLASTPYSKFPAKPNVMLTRNETRCWGRYEWQDVLCPSAVRSGASQFSRACVESFRQLFMLASQHNFVENDQGHDAYILCLQFLLTKITTFFLLLTSTLSQSHAARHPA